MDPVDNHSEIDLELLRGVALGGKRSFELQLLLDSQSAGKGDFQALALAVASLSVPEEAARATFERLRLHQKALQAALSRPLGLKTAALDLLEQAERALKLGDERDAPSYWQLEQMAYRDQLTGLRNFRFFSSRLAEEQQRARRYRHQLSLVMLDIDNFKRFNDTHGHQAGNAALQHVARLISAGVRETDLVARYGGEEFALILPETSKRLAQELAERLRQSVAASPVPLASGPAPMTLSLGLATYPRDAEGGAALLERADQALYASKRDGRNRLSAYQPASRALFRYRPPEGEAVRSCAVVGSFNGWDAQADPMAAGPEGSFQASVALVPGDYEYKFVLDGGRWVSDPQAPERAADGYWGFNSILHLKG